jgi:transposase-like protein
VRAGKLAGIVCDSKFFRRGKMENDKKPAKTTNCGIEEEGKRDSFDKETFTPMHAGRARLAEFLDEEACRRWVLERLHPHGARCPRCDTLITDITTLKNFWSEGRCNCKRCDRWFTALSGTFLEGANLSIEQIFALAVLTGFMNEGVTVKRMAAAVGVSENTIRTWIRRFKVFE